MEDRNTPEKPIIDASAAVASTPAATTPAPAVTPAAPTNPTPTQGTPKVVVTKNNNKNDNIDPPKTITSPAPASGNKKEAASVEQASEELARLLSAGKVTAEDITACKSILKDHGALKEKVDKLKSLLGRSAKAQRESKIDLEATQKRLTQALREIERLNQKLDKLRSRPTHMDLLMDFETNFDKALLSVGQSGGQATSATPTVTAVSAPIEQETSAIDSMLLNELGEAKDRIEKLESLNSSLMARSNQLESSSRTLERERNEVRDLNSRLQLELKMAKMEAEQAMRAMQDKAASLEEMQMEIDLVTKANAKASIMAAKGEEAANSLKTDREHVQQLEQQVQALQEWALASAESKRLMQEHVGILEEKIRQLKGSNNLNNPGNASEQVLFSKKGSMVIGAGDIGTHIVELGPHASMVDVRFVILRWTFDFSPPEYTIEFNLAKGKCDTAALQKKAEHIIKNRTVKGGAGGDTESAFTVDNSCTLIWSNAKSWVRPRTVKFSYDVVSLK